MTARVSSCKARQFLGCEFVLLALAFFFCLEFAFGAYMLFCCFGLVMQHVAAGFNFAIWVSILFFVGLMCFRCVDCDCFCFDVEGPSEIK